MASSAAPALLFSIIFPLFFFSSSTLVSEAGDHCAPSSCGNLTNIRYPFRLKDDPPNCGDSKYELTCNHLNHTILTPLFPNYYITNITYHDYSYHDTDFEIQVKDVRMEKYNNINNNGSCSQHPLLPSPHTLSKLMGNRYYWTFDWVTLVNCSKEVKNKSMHHYYNYYRPVPCLSHNNNSSFIYYLIESFSVGDLMVSCSFLATFPYNKQSGQQPTDDIFKLLAQEYTFYGGIFRLSDVTSRDCFRKSFSSRKIFICGLTIYVFLSYKLYKMISSVDIVEKFLRNQQTLLPTKYSYTDIIAMTSHFKEKVGRGGFGSVFKSRLPWDRLVAIKMLTNSKYNTSEDFINEISTIGRIHHINVVKLIDKLTDIALGVARGLDYLHKGCDMQILHFDIKPHNILLDNNFNPKLSDFTNDQVVYWAYFWEYFGLAKLYPKNNGWVSLSVARGTIGYIAPELISRSFGVISHKCDVYSFGMLLLEMACGRRNSDPRAENTSQVYYPSWIYDKLINSTIENDIVEMDACIMIDEKEKKLCMIGLWCIHIRLSDRPSMNKVIEMLEGNVSSLQMPPKPFFSEPT
ncbi:Glycerophosphodiester phosphodiesterase protein [Dioscorea alata]|uniref:Glycerophosphodiester phosphodiesterase protein n=1 Tax=Dioscorea alata TaxID=55571 RepID=A0ACB7UG54_DIOAL|nr:Glycerophosphodiester phosphodiesterase protein [Dioscorea alata]